VPALGAVVHSCQTDDKHYQRELAKHSRTFRFLLSAPTVLPIGDDSCDRLSHEGNLGLWVVEGFKGNTHPHHQVNVLTHHMGSRQEWRTRLHELFDFDGRVEGAFLMLVAPRIAKMSAKYNKARLQATPASVQSGTSV